MKVTVYSLYSVAVVSEVTIEVDSSLINNAVITVS
jgi:hypothetical protein